MKTTTSPILYRLVWMYLILISQLTAQHFAPFKKEFNEANITLPYQLELDIPATALVRLEVLKLPKNTRFYATFPQDPAHKIHAGMGQARLKAGRHRIEIRDNNNRKNLTGALHIIAHVTPETDSSEPNDSFQQARPITLGETTLSVFPAGDVDFLNLKLNDRGYLRISAIDAPKGFIGSAAVFDEWKKSLGVNYVHIPTSGNYYIRYQSKNARKSSAIPYKIKVEFYPEQDPAEPNNSITDAAIIPIGAWQQAMSAPVKDVDFHALDIKHEGRIAVNLENVDPQLALRYYLYDSTGKYIRTAHPFAVKPGRYYVGISSEYSRSSLKPYRVKFDLLPIGKFTPSSAKEPKIIEANVDQYTRIPAVETDRFALKIDKFSIVHAKLFIPENSDYRMSYQLKGGRQFESNNLWLRTSDPVVPFFIKPYYRKVSRAPLRVWTLVEDEFDPSEPNDLLKDSTELTLKKPREFYIYPYRDTDWFKLKIDKPSTYYLHIVQSSNEPLLRFNNLEVTLLDQAGRILRRIKLGPREYGFSSGEVELSTAGQYHLKISANGSSKAPLVIGVNESHSLLQPLKDDSNLDVFMAGVELKPEVAKRMKKMVLDGGGEFINAKKADQIGDKLVEISDKIEKRSAIVLDKKSPGKGGAGKWLLIILGVIVLLIIVKKKFQPSSKPREEI